MIYNKTKKTLISENYRLCKSSYLKALGLMFRTNPKSLVFVFDKEKIVPLHMFFVFFPIDVLYLDKNKRVVETKINLMPFTFYKAMKKSSYVIELPSGTIQRTNSEVGDKIKF
jgi:uncharacterized membrane protein (UPF0127 family)